MIKQGSYPYYTIQLQNGANSVLQIVCYNTKAHSKLLQILKSENPIKIELQPPRRDSDSVKFNSSCLVTSLLQIDVEFKLNCELKLSIEMEKESRETKIGNLTNINASANTELFTVTGKVIMGTNNLDQITTANGFAAIKRDVYIQDETGFINLQIFENRLREFKQNCFYKITCAKPSSYRRNIYLSLTKNTVITSAAEIENLTAPNLFGDSTTYDIDGFDGFRNVKIFYNCKNCKKQMDILNVNDDWVVCGNLQCNAQIRSKKLKFNGSVEVNFEISEDEDMWATMYAEIVEQVCGKIRNTEQIQNCLKEIGNCNIVVNKGVIKELKVTTSE